MSQLRNEAASCAMTSMAFALQTFCASQRRSKSLISLALTQCQRRVNLMQRDVRKELELQT